MPRTFIALRSFAAALIAVAVLTLAAEGRCADSFPENPEPGARVILTLKGVEVPFRYCPPGAFEMGSPETEEGRSDSETLRPVRISRGFWTAESETTQELYEAVTGKNPSSFKTDKQLPVDSVSWNDASEFAAALTELEGEAHKGVFRLPYEAEWEYACRAGSPAARYGELDEIAWHIENAGFKTHPAGQKEPNAWGLQNMIGNVWEWCADWYADLPEPGADPLVDPKGADAGEYRITRGGCWSSGPESCRAAYRTADSPSASSKYQGFRILFIPDAK